VTELIHVLTRGQSEIYDWVNPCADKEIGRICDMINSCADKGQAEICDWVNLRADKRTGRNM
jgi:hypothetical protein